MAAPATRNYIGLFIGALLFHLAGTWSLPLIDRDEPRFAEASREMLQRSDYVIPYFNNEYRFDKPPLTYWAQVASYRVFGENDFAARFPTAVAAALVAVVLLAWGGRVEHASGLHRNTDRKREACVTGWWAAGIFTLCLQTFLHGKAAVADMWLVLFVTLAHWSGWETLRGEARTKFIWIFYPSLALAFLAKGPIGWTPLLTLLCSRGARPRVVNTDAERRRSATAATKHAFGILLMLALVCLWGIPALLRTQGEFFNVAIGKHVVARSLATMEGHGANSFAPYLALLPFYFVTVFASLFPWSLKLPALVRRLWRERDATDNFLLIGALIIFGIFTLVKTKLPHYTLPAFPLLALLMARRAEQLNLSLRLAWLTAAVLLLVSLTVPPLVSRLVPSYDLEQQSRFQLQREMEFGAIDYTEPSLVWYFRRDVSGFMTTLRGKDAAAFLQNAGPRFVIVPTSTVNRLFPALDPSWRSYRARGWNPAKAQRVDVTMLLKH